MTYPRFELITSLAYSDLINDGWDCFPIHTESLIESVEDNIIITSFQNYAKITKIDVNVLTLAEKYPDGLAIDGLRPGIKMILYNEDSYTPRMKYTILHEIGHFKCNHKKHGKAEEVEANFYASQFLMPDIILETIKNRGYNIDAKFLTKHFDVSIESAEKKLATLNKFRHHKSTSQDKLILSQFRKYIEKVFPFKVSKSKANRFWDAEKQRGFLAAHMSYLDPDL